MYITVDSILKEHVFKDAVVLSGNLGLSNTVKRVSVFDCPFRPRVLNSDIIGFGDLFLSELAQFINEPDKLKDFLCLLSDAGSSALFVTNENANLITPDIVKLSDVRKLPIVSFDRNIPYAVVMDAINKRIYLEFNHAINGLWLNRILLGNLSLKEVANALHAINPAFKRLIQVLIIRGNQPSVITQSEMTAFFAAKPDDTYIFYENNHYFIFSENSEQKLRKKVDTNKQFLPRFFTDFSMGIGMVHDLLDITSCLREANLLLDAAASLNINILEYSSDSFFQLILLLKDSPELYRYYSSFLEKLNAFDSENGNILFLTVKEFVISKGSYSDVAEHMNQHENTIRYRINKVRQLFNMEDDLISFYNTISVLTAIDALV